MRFDVIVIGGGASGMMAAGRAAERGKRVLLLEKNKKLGEKLKITGGGRCNIANAEPDVHTLLKNYGSAEQFLYSPFAQFGVADTFSFFEKRGLPLVVQAHQRAFPQTERAADVAAALEKYMQQGGVVVKINSAVSSVLHEKNRITGVVANGGMYAADSYILATGGVSHAETGSTGDGFGWLRELGHAVSEPSPTIVPLKVKEAWAKQLSGVSLPSVKIIFYADGVKQFSKTGAMLFTHFGISGPLVLQASGAVGDLLHSGIVTAQVDLFPTLDLGALEAKLLETFDANKNKMLKNALADIVPSQMCASIFKLSGVADPDIKVHSVTKEQRKKLVQVVKNIPLTITGLMGYDRAVVADGGVALSEVDTKTMRSKCVENLFVTGDLLHIMRPSGGFSLQLCWTTGFVAGDNC
jgi:predicted Rossmann fold flavoprotein